MPFASESMGYQLETLACGPCKAKGRGHRVGRAMGEAVSGCLASLLQQMDLTGNSSGLRNQD